MKHILICIIFCASLLSAQEPNSLNSDKETVTIDLSDSKLEIQLPQDFEIEELDDFLFTATKYASDSEIVRVIVETIEYDSDYIKKNDIDMMRYVLETKTFISAFFSEVEAEVSDHSIVSIASYRALNVSALAKSEKITFKNKFLFIPLKNRVIIFRYFAFSADNAETTLDLYEKNSEEFGTMLSSLKVLDAKGKRAAQPKYEVSRKTKLENSYPAVFIATVLALLSLFVFFCKRLRALKAAIPSCADNDRIKSISRSSIIFMCFVLATGFFVFPLNYDDVDYPVYFESMTLFITSILGLSTLILSYIFVMIAVYKIWKVVPKNAAEISPGWAIGMLFIPFANIYAIYLNAILLPKKLNESLAFVDEDGYPFLPYIGAACIVMLVLERVVSDENQYYFPITCIGALYLASFVLLLALSAVRLEAGWRRKQPHSEELVSRKPYMRSLLNRR